MSALFDLANVPVDFTNNPYPYYHQILERSPVLSQPDGSFLVAPWNMLDEIYRFSMTRRCIHGFEK